MSLVQLIGKTHGRLLPPPHQCHQVCEGDLSGNSLRLPSCFDFLTRQSFHIGPSQFSDKRQPHMQQAGGYDKRWDKALNFKPNRPRRSYSASQRCGPCLVGEVRRKELTFNEYSLCSRLRSRSFISVLSFNPQKQPCMFNATELDT